MSGNQGEECPSSWRYLLDVESRERPGPACFPLPQSDAAKKSKAPGSGAATAPQPEQQAAAELVTEVREQSPPNASRAAMGLRAGQVWPADGIGVGDDDGVSLCLRLPVSDPP